MAEMSRLIAVGTRTKDAKVLLAGGELAASMELDVVEARCVALAVDFARMAGDSTSARTAQSRLDHLSSTVSSLPIVPSSGSPLLTARERQIARLAGRGTSIVTSPRRWASRSAPSRATCTRFSLSLALPHGVICLDSSSGRVPKSGSVNRQLTGRRETMERVCQTILNKTSQAVFLISGPGIGKSALVEAISERLTRDMNVLRIHGSSSLAKVPFGVLAPYTSGLSAEDAISPVAVLRSVWSYFQKLRSAKDGPLLLVVDDAHHLDDATASIVVDMVSAGWASVLATGRSRPGLPAAMNQLWYDGLADRIDLRPLTQEQVAEAVAHALEGIVPESTVQALWAESGVIPYCWIAC
ncbi:AAA family ATPase [Arthrobacter sp. SA17]